MSENVKEKYSPEVIGQALGFPLQGVRVLREIVDATESSDPLPTLLRAHTELLAWIASVRQQYLNRASSLMDTAGAFGDVHMIEPFPEKPKDGPDGVYTTKATAGFKPNQEA